MLYPAYTNIIVRQDSFKKIGRIILTEGAGKEFEKCEGEITHIGPECEIAEVGDTVVYGKYTTLPVEEAELGNSKEVTHSMIREGDILYWKNRPAIVKEVKDDS